jgi:hypothetical protein
MRSLLQRFFRRKIHPLNQMVIDLFRGVSERNKQMKTASTEEAEDLNIKNQIDLNQIQDPLK